MANYNIRYRFMDRDTGDIISSSPPYMTNLKKDGGLFMFHTTARKAVFTSKTENMILQVATRKVNGKWLYETITPERNKETLLYKVSCTVRKLIKKIKGGDK
jgi:hypothetical protein